MSIYRRKHHGKRSRWYTAEFVWHGQTHRRGRFVDRDSALHWVRTEQLKLGRGEVGYVKPMLSAQVTPLIDRYVEHVRSMGRDAWYAQTLGYRLKRLAGECGWMTLGNVTRHSFESWQQRDSVWEKRPEKPIGPRTKNQYLEAARQWGKWLVADHQIPSNPFAGVQPLKATLNESYRRAATLGELDKLLSTCPKDRRLYYIFRIYTPIRGRTIAGLTWRMVHLDAAPPFVLTPAELNKSRRPEKHVVRYDVAQELRALRKRTKAKADDAIFAEPPTLEDFRADLTHAGVRTDDGRGNNRLDYHALRTTLVQIAKQAGLTAFQIMDLVGWRTMSTMMKHYNKLSAEPERGASMEKLPAIGKVRRA